MRKNYTPYLREETKLLMEERKVLKEEMTRQGDKVLAKEVKLISKEIKKAVKNDENEYYERGLDDKVDVSTAWKTANELLGNIKNLAPTAIKVIGNDGMTETVTNPQKLATLFNKYFRRKVETLRAKTNNPPVIPPSERLRKWLQTRDQPPPPFALKEIDRKTFRFIMSRMKGKRLHGVDWIDAYSLKIASPLIEDSLFHLVNLSIRQGKFSRYWKPQLIHPFHKKKEKDKVENYRPVSHLVQVGKLVEYAANFQIIEHFTTFDLFHHNHHGSLAHHSTATAVIQLFDSWLQAAEQQKLSAVCLIDQSAAYDLLCHQTLREKLVLYNFNESSISWTMSYLSERSQVVQVESKVSDPLPCDDHGVPQGSVLGGLLHLINSNDFPACHDEGEAVVYVDDDSDSVHDADPVKLKNLIQQETENSAAWLSDNRLCVAGDKSKLMVIGTRSLRNQKLTNKMKIQVDGKEVTQSESEKLLGVVINSELTWRTHLYGDNENEGLVPQLSKRIGILKKLSTRMSKDRLKQFASGIFYSKLSYCLPVFGHVFGLESYKESNNRYTSYTTADNNRLQVLQNKLNRLITGAQQGTPTSKLLEQTDSLSIQQMIAFQTMVMTAKILKSRKPTYLSDRIQGNPNRRNYRGGYSLHQPKTSLSITREGFIQRGIALMNKIDVPIRFENKIEEFKKGLRKWVKSNIAVKPTPRFPVITARVDRPQVQLPQPPPRTEANHTNNLITRYFQPADRTT